MIKNRSGFIYEVPLDFEMGYCYGELIDFTTISDFDGLLFQVFNYFRESKSNSLSNIDEIVNSGLYFGPVPLDRNPNIRGKGAWKQIGSTTGSHKPEDFAFKQLRGVLNKDYDWSKYSPWYRFYPILDKIENEPVAYESVRRLETVILTHPQSVATKLTMMKIIDSGQRVKDFYDLADRGNLNLYLQIINTYCPLDETIRLIKEID